MTTHRQEKKINPDRHSFIIVLWQYEWKYVFVYKLFRLRCDITYVNMALPKIKSHMRTKFCPGKILKGEFQRIVWISSKPWNLSNPWNCQGALEEVMEMQIGPNLKLFLSIPIWSKIWINSYLTALESKLPNWSLVSLDIWS